MAQLPVGSQVADRFIIEGFLGQGGMGAVYRARHRHTHRLVALKLIRPEYGDDPDFQSRFLAEAAAMGAIHHVNVADVVDFGYSGDGADRFPYLALEFLEGVTLSKFLSPNAGIPWAWVRDILAQVCAGLAAAHERGVIHGDLKPENVWLRPRASGGFDVKILDFGLAQTQSATRVVAGPTKAEPASAENTTDIADGRPIDARTTRVRSDPGLGGGPAVTIAGTPAYMSPEQWRGVAASRATDIFSLGVMAYRLLTGAFLSKEALTSESGPEAAAKELAKSGAPESAIHAIGRALNSDPARRPTARNFGEALFLDKVESKSAPLLIRHNLRQSIRSLGRRPLRAAVIVATLAAGIAAATSVFTIIRGVILRPLPYREPERIVRVYDIQPACTTCPASPAKLDDWRRRNQVFSALGGVTVQLMTYAGEGEARRVRIGRATASMGDIFGTGVSRGRWFTEAEDQPGGPQIVVLSHELWATTFGSDPSVIGRTMKLNGVPREIVGVLPPNITIQRADAFVPLQEAVDPARRGNHFIPAYARLKPGVSVEEAGRQMRAAGEVMAKEFGHNHGIDVQSLLESIVGGVRPQLGLLAVAAGLLLLIACANAASLLTASGLDRIRELSIRMSLGASRSAIAGLLMSEGLVLASAASVLGLGLAAFLTPSLVGLASAQLPRTNTIGIDWSVFLFAIALAMTVGALCSAWPSWSLGRRDLSAAVREGGATGVSRSGTRVGNLLVVTEVALAATLAIASLLLVKDLSRLRGRNAGIVAEGVMTVSIDASGPLYPGRVERVGFYKQLAERLARAPEIRSFGLTSHLPMLDWGWNSEFNVDRKNPWPADKAPLVEHRWTHGDYFKTLGIPLLRGRWLDEREAGTPGTDRGPLTVLVNQAMAEKFWPGEDPIGRKFGQGTDTTQWYEVVGVVGNIRTAGLARAPLFEFFRTIDQDFQGTMTLVLKTRSSDPGDAIPVVRGIVTSIDPSLPLSRVQLLEDAMAASVGQQRLVSTLTSLFGGLAALLAAAGVFSVMTFSVRRQLREFAIRISFGARAADVRGLVLMRTGRLLAMGLTGGALFAWAGAALLQRNLLEVSPTDPATIAQGLIVVGVLTLIATLVPARAAAAASPLSLIRNNE